MPRIETVTPEKAPQTIKDIYTQIEKKMGSVPNIFQHMGNSPAVLKAYLALSEAAGQTTLSPEIRELIALTVGQANQCNYCLSAHTLIGKNLGLQATQIMDARKGISQQPKTESILKFAKSVIDKKGKVSDEEVSLLKSKGVSDQELAEIILVINLNIFTNYFNHIVNTKIDFPEAPKLS